MTTMTSMGGYARPVASSMTMGTGMAPQTMMSSSRPPATMMAGSGFMPPSTMQMSRGMPGQSGMMPSSFQAPPPAPAQPQSFLESIFGGGDEPPPPPPQPQAQSFKAQNPFMSQAHNSYSMRTAPAPQQMVTIPWQSQKVVAKQDDEKKDNSLLAQDLDIINHGGFDNLSVEELQSMAQMRARVIDSLETEIKELGDGESRHEERLAKLEKQFGELANGSNLKFKAPLLAKISKVVRDSHLLDHEAQIAELKEAAHSESLLEQDEHIDVFQYTHAQNLALGRGFMALDQHALEKKRWEEQLGKDQHPIVRRMHYAGHVAAQAENVESIFVKESGVYKKQPLHPAPYRNGFWLSLDGVSREDAHEARQAASDAAADPVAQRVSRQNYNGSGGDAQAVDWLGAAKAGEYIDHPLPRQDEWIPAPPRWMY